MSDGPSPVAPSCSVVVPVRDDAAQLRGLLACLAAQTEPPHEVIVVDNGSRDDTAAIAAAAGCRVIREGSPGIPAAAGTGYDAAHGELIVRCDADSRPGPAWIAAHRRAHTTARPGTVAVTGPGWFSLSWPARPLGPLLTLAYLGGYVLATGAALGHPPLFGTTMSMRRDWWATVRDDAARTADVHDDMDLSFRVRPAERVAFRWGVGVGMSARALRIGPAAAARWRRALRTLRRAWAHQPPWQRWGQRLREARR